MNSFNQVDMASSNNEYLDEFIDALASWQEKFNNNWLEDDKTGRFNPDKWKALQESGLTGMLNSIEVGGLGLGAVAAARIMQTLGSLCHDGGLGFALCTHLCSTCLSVEQFGTAEIKQKYLSSLISGDCIGAHAITEPGSGSDAFSMTTKATKTEGGWLLNGTKIFVSNAPIADVIVVYACSNPDKGTLGGFSAFLVNTQSDDVVIGPSVDKMGLKTSPLSDVYLNDVFVPDEALLGREGMAFVVLDYVMKWEVICVFAWQVGEMQKRLRMCIEHARNRNQFGEKISKFQAVSHRLADMHIKVETCKYWLMRAAQSVQSKGSSTEDIAIAKLVISENNMATAIDAISTFGGSGYMADIGLEKQLRDSVGGILYSGTSDIQRSRIAAMLGL
ncbi:acyl-CoA dehydrogenase family protein [Motiliproteus sp. MSK22-1]|uniref:acyl-CoA dehydrogenase family protein n=1 Tax=Motiliproteus sp. MSK22-1 TaxID=1897630 RepID=UPI0009FB3AF6|nr:acyl-CoA dehydrogenase family protein [Motiliproteus sp. MSK22-1]